MERLPEGSKIEILYGEMKTILKAPVITKETVKRKYWFGSRTIYYVDWEFCRIGPMTLENAEEHIAIAARYKCY